MMFFGFKRSLARAGSAAALAGLLLAAPGAWAAPTAPAAAATAGPPAAGTVFLADTEANSIIEYAPGANGNVAPIATIVGSNTGLANPVALALSPSGDLFVANHAEAVVTEYAPGANGNATPIATITGSNTGISFPGGVAVNAAGDLFVANGTLDPTKSSVTEYAPGANGNATPIATIPAASFGSTTPGDLAIDSSGDLFVPGTGDDSVFEFAPGASGAATPIATITGSNTGLSGPGDIALTTSGTLVVANFSNSTTTTYAAGANGNATPTATLNVGGLRGVGLDSAGDEFATFGGEQVGINEYAPGATGGAAPVGSITGSNTTIEDPSDVLIAPDAPTHVAFVRGPSDGSAGTALGTQPQVAIEDAAGNVVTTNTSQVKLVLRTVSGNPNARLSCTGSTGNTVQASAGVAAFAGCGIEVPSEADFGGTYTLRATDGSLTGATSTTFTIATPAQEVDLAWSQTPIAEAGTLGSAATVALTVTIQRGGQAAAGAVAYLSLARADASAGHADDAKAECGTTQLPAYCQAGTAGKIHVTYTSATTAATGSDTLTAALDPDGTDGTSTAYTYPAAAQTKVTSLNWSPGPIAAAGSLPPDHNVTVHLAALAADGAPVPHADVHITLADAPHSDAQVQGAGHGGCSGFGPSFDCHTDATGRLTLTYTSSSQNSSPEGSDALTATIVGSTEPSAVDLYSHENVGDFTWNLVPAAEAGTLGSGAQVPLTVTVHQGSKVAPGARVYLSLTRADVSGGQADDAKAECGTTALPAFCQADSKGKIGVTYTTATTAGAGSDTLTAALDPFGTGAATTGYTYLAPAGTKVTAYSWDPGPIASAGSLAPGQRVTVRLAALAADGRPVPHADVQVTLATAPDSDATVNGTAGCSGSGPQLDCHTDATGHLTLTYIASGSKPHGGSDALTATTFPPDQESPTAQDLYTYDTTNDLTWSLAQVGEAGTLGPASNVPLTLTVRRGGTAAAGAFAYVSLTRAHVTPGDPDDATAKCGTTTLPAFCKANASGRIQVTYTTATVAGTGSDTLTAAVDPDGTDATAIRYTYVAPAAARVTSLNWEPGPIAPESVLPSGNLVTVRLAALTANGRPIPDVEVQIKLVTAPGSDAMIQGDGACAGTGSQFNCQTDVTGHLTITYMASGSKPHGGSDTITATTFPVTPLSVTAADAYSYLFQLP